MYHFSASQESPPPYSEFPQNGEISVSVPRSNVASIPNSELISLRRTDEDAEQHQCQRLSKQAPSSSLSYEESLFGSPKKLKIIQMIATEELLRRFANADLSIFSITLTIIWEYCIYTLVRAENVKQEARLQAEPKQHKDVGHSAVSTGKRKSSVKISAPLVKSSRRHQQNLEVFYGNYGKTRKSGEFHNVDFYHLGEKKHVFPREFFQDCNGACVYEKILPGKSYPEPITKEEFSREHRMIKKSERYVEKHNVLANKKSRILSQTQQISLIPVYEITYSKDGKIKPCFYIVGTNHKIYFS